MNTCRTCKYYISDPLGKEYPNDGECCHDMVSGYETPANGIQVNGGCGNDWTFWIGPEFGCIHHEEKKEK